MLKLFFFCVNLLYLVVLGFLVGYGLYIFSDTWWAKGGMGLFFILAGGLLIWLCKQMIPEILSVTREKIKETPGNAGWVSETTEERIMRKLNVLFYEEYVYREAELRIEDIARRIGTNRTYLSSLIHKHFGLHFGSFVNIHRIGEARYLLKTSEENIGNIASRVGFNSTSAFYACFREYCGQSPKEWKSCKDFEISGDFLLNQENNFCDFRKKVENLLSTFKLRRKKQGCTIESERWGSEKCWMWFSHIWKKS